jgi:hypothetical protein
MSDETEQPDHTEDPRKQDTGQGGYPESNPEPTSPERGGGDSGGGDMGSDAPSPSTDKEPDRDHSTGNPGAAG